MKLPGHHHKTISTRAAWPLFFCLGLALAPAWAATKHKDVATHTVAGSVFPPVLGGSWTVDSRLDILNAEPHQIPNGSLVGFSFKEFYNLSAPSFTPLIVPGTPNVAPAKAGDLLDAKTWTFSIKNEGCAVFDYSKPWSFEMNPNLGSRTSPEFELGLSKGPVSFNVKWGGATIPDTKFSFTPFPNELRIEFATSDQGQGFFGNGGSMFVNGLLKGTADTGKGKVFAENPHYASGSGALVADYTWALPDAAGAAAVVTTSVFDEYTCCAAVPEPSMAWMLLPGLAVVATRLARRLS